MPKPGTTTSPLSCVQTRIALVCLLFLGFGRFAEATDNPTETIDLPEGTISSQTVRLEAPEAACIAYLENYRIRRWIVRVRTPEAFEERLRAAGLTEPTITAVMDMELWSPAPDGRGFAIAPPPELTGALPAAEKRMLYRVLARWNTNKPERWPLVFSDDTAFSRLTDSGVSDAFVARVRSLCIPFAGGWALSDFSVLAAEFPEREMLLRFLQEASAVKTTIPRLRIRRAASIAQVLDYWTANAHNPYTRPLLEALAETDLPDGVDLATILPGNSRELSYNLSPEDVPRDISLSTFMISSSLALPPKPLPSMDAFLQRLDDEFDNVQPPERFGDLLIIHYPGEVVVPYACGYVVAGLAFARDPVGLGLWRFMRPEEVLRRNPHFENAGFELRRVRAQPPLAAPSP